MQIFKGPVKNIFSVWFLPSRGTTWGLVWGCHPHRLAPQRRSAQIKSFLPVINAPCSSGGAAFSALLMLRQFPWQPAGCCFPFYLMETEGPAGCRQSISLTTRYNCSRAHCVCVCACETVEKDPASFRCPLRAIRVDIDPLLLLHLLHQPRLNAPSLPLLLSSSLSLSLMVSICPSVVCGVLCSTLCSLLTADLHSGLFIVDSRRRGLLSALPMMLQGGCALVYHPPVMHY